MDWRRRNWWWVLLAALAIGCFAPSTGGGAVADRALGGPAVTNLQLHIGEPAVLGGSDVTSQLADANRSLPDPFVRIVAILAALGIAAAAMRGRSGIDLPVRERPRPGRRGDVLLRGPPRVAC